MTDLKRKVRVRAGHKGYVTKTITDARALISSGDQADLKKLKSLQSILRDKLVVPTTKALGMKYRKFMK